MSHFYVPDFDPEEGRRCNDCDCREYGTASTQPCPGGQS